MKSFYAMTLVLLAGACTPADNAAVDQTALEDRRTLAPNAMPQDMQDSSGDTSLAVEAKLRRVRYTRHEYPRYSVRREDSLLVLVYDIPYFGACGVFPPFHLFNQLLLTGGSEGGMSPGATWEPFSLSEQEYQNLVDAVRVVPPQALKRRARYALLPYKFDSSLNHHQDYFEWLHDMCEKHREAWHAELKRAGSRE